MKTEIEQFSPCKVAVGFRKQYNTFKEAWNACPRGDWMLWIAKKLHVDKRILTLAKGHCTNTVRHLMRDERSIKAVDAAIAYGNGEIDDNELETAADDAAAAYAAAAHATVAAREANQKETADICRKYITEAVLEKIKEL